jgi:hypothetical protein
MAIQPPLPPVQVRSVSIELKDMTLSALSMLTHVTSLLLWLKRQYARVLLPMWLL